ncbi:hypothetical protein [Streptomyces parvus]|uniref:hypothetical protein n=1 Tax=Streptomyces parvus TaxID=66428 RepID=UPI0021CCDB3D|nr:hypothetical protein [Streptomyces parvus]
MCVALNASATRAAVRQREHDRLGEWVERLEGEYGAVADADLSTAAAERQEIEQWFAGRETGLRSSPLSREGGRP